MTGGARHDGGVLEITEGQKHDLSFHDLSFHDLDDLSACEKG
jgi:hypothetical protein